MVLVVLGLGGCATSPVLVPPSQAPGELPTSLAPYLEAGPDGVSVSAQTLESDFGCTVAYEVYQPTRSADSGLATVTVVLGHGFMSDLASMRGWAEQWASHGVQTAVVSFCNSSWVSGRHDRNAADMIAVADLLLDSRGPRGAVIYAGFSAGGLSALLAMDSDPRAVAYLGLDPVDSGGLAMGARNIEAPSLFLFGEPSSCNAANNMEQFLPRTAVAFRIPYATHCDFQNPYDMDCERFCGSVAPAVTAAAIRKTILGLATAWIVDHGLDGDAGAMSVDATLVDELERARRIVQVQ
jgi:pimeloyl-ACP methyl ester carboxylesterase